MKKKSLVLAVCMAFTTPTISYAKTLPSDLLGVSLGEIQSNSNLHEPFQAVIPVLFAGAEQSNQLKVKLAPDSVYKQIGAEKLPVHNSLSFRISVKNNKPVILVNSVQPIQIPFLNFVLEVQSQEGSIYQDYTALLDPADYKIAAPAAVSVEQAVTDDFFTQAKALLEAKEVTHTNLIPEQEIKKLQSDLLLSAYSTPRLKAGQPTKYVVKAGDSLSQIAQSLNTGEVSLNKMIKAIHLSNPNAFAKNDINQLTRGAVLRIPTVKEINSSNFAVYNKQETIKKEKFQVSNKDATPKTPSTTDTYKVKSGDTLFNIAKKISNKSLSLTKTMKELHSNNPHAFSKNNINRLIAGAVLSIPSTNKNVASTKKETIKEPSENKTADATSATKTIASIEKNESPKSTATDIKQEKQGASYIAKKGDTLSKITKELGHENISFTKMMKSIFSANPDAFMKNNITHFKEGSVVTIPTIDEVNNESHTVATSKSTIEDNNQLIINSLEKRLRELRRKLAQADSQIFNLESGFKDNIDSIKEQFEDKKTQLISQIDKEVSNETTNDASQLEPLPATEKVVDLENETTNPGKKVALTNNTLPEESDWQPVSRQGYIPENATSVVEETLISHFKTMSNKDLAYSAMALFLGLLLIGYRKQLYEYVSIPYDGPKYYSSEDTKKIRLSEEDTTALEKEILNFHQTLINNEVENPDSNESIEINKDFLNECETLAEDLYKNTETAETTRDKFSNSNIDKLKTEMTYESSVLDEIINRHVSKETNTEDHGTDTIGNELSEKTEATNKSPLQFEEVTLDLFEDPEDATLETEQEIDTSEDVLSDDNSIVPKTDWEKVLYNADLELARSELELKEEENDEATKSDSHETSTDSIEEPEALAEVEVADSKQELLQPFNFSSGTFETLDMPEINTIKTDFTPTKSNLDKFNEAVEDEIWNYEEYCRNEPVVDIADIEKELETA